MAMGGHVVIPMAIRPQPGPCALSNEQIIAAIEQHTPDLIVLGNIHSAQMDPAVIGLVARRWPTIQVLHDMYSLTGRCAYTGDCRKYVDGCDHTCPTPQEYPALDPALIRQAWETKNQALSGPFAPVLAAATWTCPALRADSKPPHPSPASSTSASACRSEIFRPRDKAMCRRICWDCPGPVHHSVLVVASVG